VRKCRFALSCRATLLIIWHLAALNWYFKKIVLDECKIVGNSKVNLTDMNENNDLKDRVGIQMDQLNF
jgi:hypothetical protein